MRVVSVNVGRAAPLAVGGRRFLSGIHKRAVDGPVALGPLGLAGDEQADLSVHGGLDKAVYAYPVEHHAFWTAARGGLFDAPLSCGAFGENLSIEGLREHEVWIGDRLIGPGWVLRVTAPREPCFKFNAVMGLPDAGRRMMEARCSGFYLAVDQAGPVQAGDRFALQPGTRGLRVDEAFAAKRFKHLR